MLNIRAAYLERGKMLIPVPQKGQRGESGKNLRTSGGHLNLHIDLGVGRIKKKKLFRTCMTDAAFKNLCVPESIFLVASLVTQ